MTLDLLRERLSGEKARDLFSKLSDNTIRNVPDALGSFWLIVFMR